jgi:hypothetical protein
MSSVEEAFGPTDQPEEIVLELGTWRDQVTEIERSIDADPDWSMDKELLVRFPHTDTNAHVCCLEHAREALESLEKADTAGLLARIPPFVHSLFADAVRIDPATRPEILKAVTGVLMGAVGKEIDSLVNDQEMGRTAGH